MLAGGVGGASMQGITLIQLTSSSFAVKQSTVLSMDGPVLDFEVLAASPWYNGT